MALLPIAEAMPLTALLVFCCRVIISPVVWLIALIASLASPVICTLMVLFLDAIGHLPSCSMRSRCSSACCCSCSSRPSAVPQSLTSGAGLPRHAHGVPPNLAASSTLSSQRPPGSHLS